VLARLISGAAGEGTGFPAVGSFLALLLAIYGGRSLLVWIKEQAGFKAGAGVRRRVRTALLDKIVARGPAGVSRESSAALTTALVEQVEGLHDFFALFMPQMALALAIPAAILVCVFPLTWAAGLVLLVTAPLIPAFMVLVGMGADAVSQRHFTALARMSNYFLDLLQGFSTLKLLGRGRDREGEIAQVSASFRRRTLAVLRIAFLSSAVLEFFSALAIAMVAVYLGTHYLGYIAFGSYGQPLSLNSGLFILFLAPEFYAPLRELGTRYHSRATALGAAEEIRRVLDDRTLQPLDPTAPEGMIPGSDAPRLSLHGVGLTYSHRRQCALADISLTIDPGETLALVGPSGAGKSTLLNLLMGFLRSDTGEIRVDGKLLEKLDSEAWWRRIAWIGQRPALFSGTLKANICLGLDAREIDTPRLEAALRDARVDQFVSRLPRGLETLVGDQGSRLSRGQAQRVALARALLKDAPLVIMDEPTAGLDRVNERDVLEGMARLARQRTVVMATHRLDRLQGVDRIAVLDQGRLVELGSYGELMAHQGVFYRLLTSGDALVSDPSRYSTADFMDGPKEAP
ncbi:MAG: thiol reductant ABC exporter subunit CydD, partial [Desulfobacterales bacterium]